jgi:PKHD-type hydroxylase
MSHLPLWYIGKIPVEVCDSATAEFTKLEAQDGKMGANGEKLSHLTRNTTVRFTEPDHWFGNILKTCGIEANKHCGWDYDITGHEAVQFAQYGPEQHYNWHQDTFPLSGQPVDRKVTVVCLMSDVTEFDAGELQLRLYQEYTAPLTKGSIIAFPSIIEHRVIPVTRGLRASATMWLNGPRFR